MKEQKGICYIVGAGEPAGSFARTAYDFVIAADGGSRFLDMLNIEPDLFVGDLDSSDAPPENCFAIKLNREKDETDTALAVREGLARGYREFKIYGGLGGRLDHSIANIQLIAELSTRQVKASLIGDGITVAAVTDGSVKLPTKKRGTVSVFCHTDTAENVTIKGLKYTLENATISNLNALGVSNEYIGKPASVSVGRGTLVIMYE